VVNYVLSSKFESIIKISLLSHRNITNAIRSWSRRRIFNFHSLSYFPFIILLSKPVNCHAVLTYKLKQILKQSLEEISTKPFSIKYSKTLVQCNYTNCYSGILNTLWGKVRPKLGVVWIYNIPMTIKIFSISKFDISHTVKSELLVTINN
jgi:hypothetical protein